MENLSDIEKSVSKSLLDDLTYIKSVHSEVSQFTKSKVFDCLSDAKKANMKKYEMYLQRMVLTYELISSVIITKK